ncbi:hypothetical protein C7Y66_29175 [Chroococcidiopsis sp. CCALA 051]|uniref:DUF6887 family protein n=1 Tax=Chroococcidiopsis sp. CCALA 051 TaxID=869949 RepID=UPI000D0D410D|nr:hypothetical protein [Chroococcidiopsis sp. CCALA 051]MBE9019305.1 hypothetical protein [Chroococcidiopsidales cyanobacterium LEGE 13417]PSM45662.1 hypothetical protein C7Y66_29175 [Chroococcidiopsis sp. CCALA 051]
MTQPNFQAMSRKELLAYMLEHRDDDEVFRVFMDKVHAEPPTEVYPAPQTIDDLKHFPQLLKKHRQKRQGEVDK